MSGAAIWLRLTVGSLSHIAPGPVARLAHSLYRNPDIARRFDSGQRDLLAEAQAIIDRGVAIDTETPEGMLRSYHFRSGAPGAPLTLLLHAWTGDARAMAAFIDPLLAAGHDVVVPDLPAHGASFGRETDAPTAARATAAMLAAHSLTPRFFIGHSFGGGVAGMLARTGTVPKRFVCIASPSQLSAITNDFCAAFGLSHRSRARFEDLVVASSGMEIADLDGLKIWPELPTRILLLHAPDDAEIDYAEATRLAAMPNATLQPMPGLGHREIVYHPDSIGTALAFLAEG
ncbi:MAG: alpha/beta hydrolase [Pseudomonadota bacterium]